MTTTPTSNIKEKVRERYGAIALQDTNPCGSNDPAPLELLSDCCNDASAEIQLVDYGELGVSVEESADLGLGCGVPTLTADIRSGETVLDLGSGAGIDVFLASRAVGPTGRVIGVDMTPEMLARARENARKGGYSNVEFRQGELEDLPVEDDSIDVILSNCVINLVPDKSRVFQEIHRVLKPGGRFSISDMVTFGDVPEAIRQDIALWTGCIAGAMDRDEYLDLIRRAGFDDVRIEKETVYDASWLPPEYRQDIESRLAGEPGEYGLASVTLVGSK